MQNVITSSESRGVREIKYPEVGTLTGCFRLPKPCRILCRWAKSFDDAVPQPPDRACPVRVDENNAPQSIYVSICSQVRTASPSHEGVVALAPGEDLRRAAILICLRLFFCKDAVVGGWEAVCRPIPIAHLMLNLHGNCHRMKIAGALLEGASCLPEK